MQPATRTLPLRRIRMGQSADGSAALARLQPKAQ